MGVIPLPAVGWGLFVQQGERSVKEFILNSFFI